MGRRWLVAAALGGAAAVVVRRMALRRRDHVRSEDGRWHSVTVDRPLEEVSTAVVGPEHLERLAPGTEVRYRRAPDGRGTEVAVRASREGRSQRRAFRSALREAKQAWETGPGVRRRAGAPRSRATPTGAARVPAQ